MRFSTLLIAVLSALILGLSALLAVGCGSSGSSSTSGGTTSRQQQTDASQKSESTAEEPKSSESKPGESGESESKAEPAPSGKPLTKAVFVKRADGICALVPVEYGKLGSSLAKEREAAKKPKPSVQEVAEKAAIPPLYTAAEKLKSLGPPTGDEQKIEDIIAALESAAQGLEENPKSEFGGPKSPFAEFQKLTKEYGLKGCAKL